MVDYKAATHSTPITPAVPNT